MRVHLFHEGGQSIRVEHPGGTLYFNPRYPVEGAVHVVTWNWPEHLSGLRQAIDVGMRPAVVATPPVLEWLGEVEPGEGVDLLEYEPIPYVTATEAVYKVRAALRQPATAIRRLAAKARLPRTPPVAACIDLPEGRLVFLGMALHGGTPEDWLTRAAERFCGAEWLITGVDHGQSEALMGKVARFGARRVLVADLVGGIRRSIGMPCEPVTPTVDRARRVGLDAYVLAAHSSLRFDL